MRVSHRILWRKHRTAGIRRHASKRVRMRSRLVDGLWLRSEAPPDRDKGKPTAPGIRRGKARLTRTAEHPILGHAPGGNRMHFPVEPAPFVFALEGSP
jgi:hypothetical protein